MKRVMVWLLSLVVAGTVWAAKPPKGGGRGGHEGELITCELTVAPKLNESLVLTSQSECDQAKGTYHYRLWLPPAYAEDATRRWPCMFISSPNGNAGMGAMGEWLKTNQFVVVMLVEAKNGPWAPIIGNFLAAHDDVVKRVRVQEGMKFATGFSGGARASSLYVQLRPGFGGLILQGAGAAFDSRGRYYVDGIQRQNRLFCAMIVGDKDPNRNEWERMRSALGTSRLLPLSFPGAHQWAPAEKFVAAMEWIQKQLAPTGAVPPALRTLSPPR